MRKLLIILFLLISTLVGAQTNYYIDPAGLDDAGEDGSAGEPWLTLGYAVTRVTTPGDTIHANAGTYTLAAQVALPIGVSLVGAGNTTIFNSTVATSETATLYLYTAGAMGDGNQVIRKIKMDGQAYTAWSAIRVRNRKDVIIKDCTIQNFLVEGVGIANIIVGSVPVNWITGIEIYGNTITNSSKRDVPPGGWGGNIRLIGVEGTQIYDNVLTIAGRTSTDDGVCIDASNGYWRDCDIYDNTIKVQPYTGEWNFAIEMKWSYGGNTFHDNIIYGEVDFPYNYKQTYSYSIDIYNNTIRYPALESYYTVGLDFESYTEGIIVRNNHISNCQIGILFNFGYLTTEVLNDVYIYYNIIDTIGKAGDTAAGWAISIAAQASGKTLTSNNVNIWNNNIVGVNNASWEPMRGISIAFSGAWTDLEIRNNIIYDFKGASFYGTLGLAGATVDYVYIENNNIDECGYSDVPTFSGITPTHYTYQNCNLNSPPLWTAGSPYDYNLTAKSPCINDGIGVGLTLDYAGNVIDVTPDIGALEYGASPPTPPPDLPAITTELDYSWSSGTKVTGTAIDDGGGTITAKGICYSTSANPTTADSKISGGTGTSEFFVRIIDLANSTTYHARAYCTNAEGTSYGADVNFTTPVRSFVTSGGNAVTSGGNIVVN